MKDAFLLLGYLAVLKGILILVTPDSFVRMMNYFIEHPRHGGAFALSAGLILVLIGEFVL